MPRLKAINFDLIRSKNEKEISRMMEDLCRLRPRGATQRLKDKNYTDTGHWESHVRYRLSEVVDPDAAKGYHSSAAEPGAFGYSDREMYDLFLAIGGNGRYVNDWTVRQWFEYKMDYFKGAATRRTSRLTSRLARPVKRVVSDTTDPMKIFSVAARQRRDHKGVAVISYNPNVHIRARSEEEAKQVFGLMFNHVWPENPNEYYDRSTDFVQMGNEAATVSPNQKCLNDLRSELKDMTAAKEFLEEEMMRLQMGIESLETYNISQFGE